jgi:hypothetical protein
MIDGPWLSAAKPRGGRTKREPMTKTISATYTTLVTLAGVAANNPATITSTGLLQDGLSAASYSSPWTITNAGSILGAGVTLASTGIVVNAGSIAGYTSGIYLYTGGSVTNQTGGTINGNQGISGTAVTIVNAGEIAGNKAGTGVSAGIALDGGSVTNQGTGSISGYYGIYGSIGAAATVVNAGTIAGSATLGGYGRAGIDLKADGSSITNQNTGTISGSYGIYDETGAVVNAGRVTGIIGIFLAGTASVTNQSGGVISGTAGIGERAGLMTVVNAGTISGSGEAIYTDSSPAAGSITNQSGGSIVGAGFAAIAAFAGSLTVVNAGVILGGDDGIALKGGGGALNTPSGSVTNQSGGLIRGVDDGIYAKGPLAVLNAGTITADIGSGIVLRGSGSVTNQSGGTISGYFGIDATGAAVTVVSGGITTVSAATVVNAGTISGNSYAVMFAGTTLDRLVADPGAVFTGNVDGGGGTLELGSAASAGTLSGFGSSITNFGSLQIDSGATWTISGNDSASGLGTIAIAGLTSRDTIDLTGFVAVSDTFANNALVLTDAGGDQTTLSIQGSFTSAEFHLSSYGATGTSIVLCFAAGTLIGTPKGQVQVEKLKAGDLVRTAHNGPRPVKWIGKGKVLSTRGRRSAATPVIVRKGALADNVPSADLRVTKAHSLYIGEVLIPVEFLVNHRTILWDDRAQEIEIYHVELDSHDVLLANGAPAESYRDDGNRWLFQNANSGWHLPPGEPYAPVLTDGPVVDAIWRQLLDRAGPRHLPPMIDDPDLHLIVDGARVDPVESLGALRVFRLENVPSSIHIASREVVPAELGLARDPRSLGVALRRVAVRQSSKFRLLYARDARLTDGFHPYEAEGNLRWTNGYAALPGEAFAHFKGSVEVVLTLAMTTTYPDDESSATRMVA